MISNRVPFPCFESKKPKRFFRSVANIRMFVILYCFIIVPACMLFLNKIKVKAAGSSLPHQKSAMTDHILQGFDVSITQQLFVVISITRPDEMFFIRPGNAFFFELRHPNRQHLKKRFDYVLTSYIICPATGIHQTETQNILAISL